MIVNGGIPTYPPHAHGPTYISHYKGVRVVRVNWKPHVTTSEPRTAWLAKAADTFRQFPFITGAPPGTPPREWARRALPIAAMDIDWVFAPPYPNFGQPYAMTLTLSSTLTTTTLSWPAGTVIAGNWHLHADLRQGHNWRSYTPRSHYLIFGSEPFTPGAKAAGSFSAPTPAYWAVGETISSRAWFTLDDGTAGSLFTVSTVIT